MKTYYNLCNEHLIDLYHAIAQGDVERTYEIEHELSTEEECVACAYALKAHGNVRKTLTHFLQEEGFLISDPQSQTIGDELKFWFIRCMILTFLFLAYINLGMFAKTYLIASKTIVTLGMFGIIGAFIMTLSSFLMIEQWILE